MYRMLEVQDQGYNNYGPSGVLKLERPNHFRVVAVFAGICDAKKTRSAEYIVDLGMKRSKETKKHIFFGQVSVFVSMKLQQLAEFLLKR